MAPRVGAVGAARPQFGQAHGANGEHTVLPKWIRIAGANAFGAEVPDAISVAAFGSNKVVRRADVPMNGTKSGTETFVIGSNLPNWAEVVTALVSALTMLTVGFAVLQVLFLNRQMHRELESLYLERYWALMDRRSSKFALGGTPNRADRSVIRAYLQLTEDQLGLRAVGRVTNHTWGFWATDIAAQCSVREYSTELACAPANVYPLVRRLITNGGKYDPLDRSGLWRVLHGL